MRHTEAAAKAKKALWDSHLGQCERAKKNMEPCYLYDRLPRQRWCKVCAARQPLWVDYHDKSNAAGAALRQLLSYAAKMKWPSHKRTRW